MDQLFSPIAIRVLLLVVLFAPLGYAALLAVTGSGYRVARRLAGFLAVLHLAVTLFVTATAALYISTHHDVSGPPGFRPVAVPGDTGESAGIEGGGEEHATSWNLFFVGKKDVAPAPAVQFFIGLDGINVWLVLLTSLMTYVAVVVSWNTAKEKAGGYYSWLFVLQTAVTGAFVSFDVVLFYVFFELTLIPTFFLIGGWGVGGGKRDAARKFFLYTLFGSLFSLIGLIGIVYTNPVTPAPESAEELRAGAGVGEGTVTFNVNRLMVNVNYRKALWATKTQLLEEVAAEKAEAAKEARRRGAEDVDVRKFDSDAEKAQQSAIAAAAGRDRHSATQAWLFFALIAGFVVKVPLVPFHTWLPSAYAEAPPAVTLLLSALLAKLGTLGMLRIVIPLCPDMSVQYGLPVFATLGAIGLVYAAFCAFAQKDVKLMAAYSSVSHLGLLVMGLFALNAEGLTGAVLHMVNHGLTAGTVFALIAFLHDRYRTTDMNQLGGLWSKYPRYTFFMIVICLAAVGLPGLNNFVSEMLLLGGLFTPWANGTVGLGLAIAGVAGIFLSAWYTFTMLKNVFFGPLREPAIPDGAPQGDLSGRETWAYLLPTAACLALGIYPQPIIDTMKYDVGVIEQQAAYARERINPSLAEQEVPPEPKVIDNTPPIEPGPVPGVPGGPVPGGGQAGPGNRPAVPGIPRQ